MPIARDIYRADLETAQLFVRSPAGVVMHELSHYVFANVDGPVGGHMIVKDKGAGGAFVVNDASRERLDRNPVLSKFVAAAGSLAEQYFCNHTNIDGARADIQAYRRLTNLNVNVTNENVVDIWRSDYMNEMQALAGCIDQNYDRCLAYLVTKRYLIKSHHVIPTWVLRPPRMRWPASWFDEIVWTCSEEARTKALSEYLDAIAGTT